MAGTVDAARRGARPAEQRPPRLSRRRPAARLVYPPRRRPAASDPYLIRLRAQARRVADPAHCPFCGGRPAKRGTALDGVKIGFRAAGVEASIDAKGSGETYYRCNGCMIEYADAERDIETILRGLRVEHEVAYQIRAYYGDGPTATDLLTRHRTAIVRRAHRRRSVLSVSVDGGELIACFLYNGVRTFGTLARVDGGPGGTSHYVFRGLGRA